MALTSLLLLVAAAWQQPGTDARAPLGRFLTQVESLIDARGLALDNDGGMWVLEQQPGRLWRIEPDGERRLLVRDLHAPRDVQRAPDGTLFVSESAGFGVLHLSADGRPLGRLGTELLQRAAGLSIAAERLVVSDTLRHRVEVFSLEGEHRFGFGDYGREAGQLVAPADLALGEDGSIYVADTGNSRVQVFDAAGHFLRQWGDWGPFPGLFFEPKGIEVRGDEVFVADSGNHRVQVFSLHGELLERFGLHALRPREGRGNLHYPAALALSPDGEFAALSEPSVDRVQVFCRSAGEREDAVRRVALQLAKPSAHFGMQLAAGGPYLFVSEPESHSIVVYENTADEPRRISRLGGLGSKTGLLTGVAGLHFDRSARDLWVCDPVLRRLSLFRLGGSEADAVGYQALLGRFVKSLDLAKLQELVLSEVLEHVPQVEELDRDGAGRFYLSDRRNRVLIVLSKEFELLEVFGRGTLEDPGALAVTRDGQQVFVLDRRGSLWSFEGSERKPRRLARVSDPFGLALEQPAAGDEGELALFVTSLSTHHVLRYSAQGELQKSWGGPGLLRGELYKPRALALDQRGHLLVLDHGNHRLVRFDRDGVYQSIFGPRLYTRLARYPQFADQEEED